VKTALILASFFLAGSALAQTKPAPVVKLSVAPPPVAAAPAAPLAAPDPNAPPPSLTNAPGTTLLLRGLEKITGRPTNIVAPIGKPVKFATLTITARYCYSTPASETPETSAFVQIEDARPDQGSRKVFSGWMYASSPGLHGMEHPLYDVWVINCSNGAPNTPVAALRSTGPAKVAAPDSSDKDKVEDLPAEAGR
jgi:hypothetical protein